MQARQANQEDGLYNARLGKPALWLAGADLAAGDLGPVEIPLCSGGVRSRDSRGDGIRESRRMLER